MKAEVASGARAYVAESWEQPPVGLLIPVVAGSQSYWRPLIGVHSCSSSVMVYHGSTIDAELAAWDVASDEAFINFEEVL